MAHDPFEKGNEPHRIDEMDERLYRRDLAGHREKRFDNLSPRSVRAPREWPKLNPEQKENVAKVVAHPTLFKKFFFFSLGFAVLAILIVVITFLTGGNTVSNGNIDVQVLGNSFTAGGDELPLEIRVSNKNATSLELVDLFVEYDKGGDATSGAGRVRDLNSLGSIAAGKSVSKNIFVTLYGEEGSIKNIDLTLQYRIHGSNAIFVKTSAFPVTLSSAPISLSSDAPKTVTPNQPVHFTVKVASNSKSTVSGMLLHVVYPDGFRFSDATPAPTSLTNTWNLGDLAPGAQREIQIHGTVFGQDGDDRAFRISTGAASASDATKIGLTYNSLLQVVTLVKPFLQADIAINGSKNDTVPVASGTNVHVSVDYANNLETQVTDAQVVVTLSGNALDTTGITSNNGFYDSAKNTVTWDKTTAPELAVIEPSEKGSLDFSIRVKPLYAPGQSLITSPAIAFSVAIKGKQPDAGGAVAEISGSQNKKAIVTSDLGFSSVASYYSGPFTNTGSIPPQANQPTTYTVTWTLTNTANPLTGGQASALLPPYVDWVGTVSPASENVVYDETTRTIRWSVGQVAAGAGTTGKSRAVSFQVRFNPSTSQVGTTPKLVLDTAVTAKDTYTGEAVSITRGAVTTRLDGDPSFPLGGGVVAN